MTPRVFANSGKLAAAAAESFKELAFKAIAAKGFFSVALSGGSTPKIVYKALAELEGVPWPYVAVFWGDDRLVPPDDSRSNYKMAWDTLLSRVDIHPQSIYRIKGELEGAAAVAAYIAILEDLVVNYGTTFDLVHLGVGPDGHTASLFPATPNLETNVLVVETFPTLGLEPQVGRVSLSLQTINAARVKQFFVTGANKIPILERIKSGEDLPAARVENAEWWLDAAAAQ